MSPHQGGACESCRFFGDHKRNGGMAAGDEGLCRFKPPVSQPEPKSPGLWPVVASKDWCGHFATEMTAAGRRIPFHDSDKPVRDHRLLRSGVRHPRPCDGAAGF